MEKLPRPMVGGAEIRSSDLTRELPPWSCVFLAPFVRAHSKRHSHLESKGKQIRPPHNVGHIRDGNEATTLWPKPLALANGRHECTSDFDRSVVPSSPRSLNELAAHAFSLRPRVYYKMNYTKILNCLLLLGY